MRGATAGAVLAVLLAGGVTQHGAAQGPALHFVAGLAAGALGAGAVLPALEGLEPGPAAALAGGAAVGAALLIGALKEIADLRGFGDPSWADLGLTVLGGLAAGLLGAAAGALAAEEPDARGALSAVSLSFALVLSLPAAEELARRGARRGFRACRACRPTPSSAPRS